MGRERHSSASVQSCTSRVLRAAVPQLAWSDDCKRLAVQCTQQQAAAHSSCGNVRLVLTWVSAHSAGAAQVQSQDALHSEVISIEIKQRCRQSTHLSCLEMTPNVQPLQSLMKTLKLAATAYR
jgi:hypothetical protein